IIARSYQLATWLRPIPSSRDPQVTFYRGQRQAPREIAKTVTFCTRASPRPKRQRRNANQSQPAARFQSAIGNWQSAIPPRLQGFHPQLDSHASQGEQRGSTTFMAGKTINVCLIGQKFMGRAHSNAYLKVAKFFNLPAEPVMDTIVARNLTELQAFAKRWGWKHATVDWKSAITNPAVDLVDVTTPNNKHREFVLAALEAGKHVASEKPLAG